MNPILITKAAAFSSILFLGIASSQAASVSIDSSKESHIRISQPNTNLGQTRLIFGSQGAATSQWRVMVQVSLADLVTSTGGGAIAINSVDLYLGADFFLQQSTGSAFELREWAVTDFDVSDNTWNDPQGSLGTDGAGGTDGTLLSTEDTWDANMADGSFAFGSEAAFVSFIQSKYDSDTAAGATLNFLLMMEDDGDFESSIPRTDTINDFQLNISYAPVPEPSSAALLGLGGLALILRRRK